MYYNTIRIWMTYLLRILLLNEFMHNYLKEHYLFKEEYNTLDVDCMHRFRMITFLSTYLLTNEN